MNKEKVLELILEVNKSLWKYWEGVQTLFNMNMKFLTEELELCDAVIEKLIGYKYSENNISSDPILNALGDYNGGAVSVAETIEELLNIEQFLKDSDLHHAFRIKEIIRDIVTLYLKIEDAEKLILNFFGGEDTSIYEELLLKIEKIINIIFNFESDFFEDHVLMAFIDYQLTFNSFEELQEKMKQIGKILN